MSRYDGFGGGARGGGGGGGSASALLLDRFQEVVAACCPVGAARYAATNLTTPSGVLNHLLVAMFACNVFLFFSSWKVAFMPTDVGRISTFLIAFLLCFQNAVVWMILNNGNSNGSSSSIRRGGGGGLSNLLQPTEFMLGMALGITIGGTILAFVLSGAFRSPASRCEGVAGKSPSNATGVDPVYQYLCHERRGTVTAIWFWSGLVFWLNLAVAAMLAIGRRELSSDGGGGVVHQYESLDGGGGGGGGGGPPDNGNFNYQAGQQQQHAQSPPSFPGDMPSSHSPTASSSSSYVGDYANVPDVRSGGQQQQQQQLQHSGGASEAARIVTQV